MAAESRDHASNVRFSPPAAPSSGTETGLYRLAESSYLSFSAML
jgi:hypothetical protein